MNLRKKVWVTNLTKGMVQRRVSKMEYPIDALMYGLNFDLSNGSLLTRQGYSVVTGPTLPAGTVRMLRQVRFPRTSASYMLAQVQYEGVDYLYASISFLPATSLSWQKIYTFSSDPGICSVAVLGDRAIITGPRTVPLVFSGSLHEDGTDWAFPIHVLVAEDNVHPQWIGDEALDVDDNTTLPIGSLEAGSSILVRSDVPKLEALRLEFKTPNTAYDAAAAHTFVTCETKVSTDVDLLDLRQGVIVGWKQKSTNYGNFTDSGQANVSVGLGNTCEYVRIGNKVTINSVVYTITGIRGDGDVDGDVRLSSSVSTTTAGCTLIQSGVFDGGTKVSLIDSEDPLPLLDPGAFTQDGMYWDGGMSIRQKIPGSALLSSGANVLVSFRYWHTSINYQVVNTVITNASIGVIDHDADTVATPVQLKFNGGQDGVTLTPDYRTATSDPLVFAVDQEHDYLICYELSLTPFISYSGIYTGFLKYFETGPGFWVRRRSYWTGSEEVQAFPPSYDQKTVTITGSRYTGFEWINGVYCGVSQIETTELATPSPIITVGRASEYNELSVIDATELTGTISRDIPAGTSLYLAVSFDDGDTYKAWCSSAWREIAKLDSGTWKYNTSATATPTWVAADVNSDLGALQEAFAISYNQMTVATFEGMSTTDWADTGGFQSGTTTTVIPAFGLLPTILATPTMKKEVLWFKEGGTPLKTHSGGSWVTGGPGVDGTVIEDSAFAQDGVIEVSDQVIADHFFDEGIPGFWFRLDMLTLDAVTSLSRLSYKAPVQPLQSIGVGRFSPCLAFLVVDSTTGAMRNYAIEISDETYTSYADCALTTGQYLYVGGLQRFNSVLLVPSIYNNTNASVLSAAYWDGTTWQTATISDGTAKSGKCLAQQGYVTITVPTDWKQCTPVAKSDRGYYIRFSVSANLSDTTRIAEAKLTLIPYALTPHEYVASFGDRIALVGSQSVPDETALSGPFAEYDWTSINSGLFRVGGPDRPVAVIDAWGTLLVAKPNGWYRLDLNTYRFVGHETPCVPINSQVVVKAPMAGTDGTRSAIYFLGNEGAYAFTGLFLDNVDDAARPTDISQFINYWDPSAVPRIDRDNLWRACGVAWKDFVLWAVPMILTENQSEQTSNNRIIAFNTRTGTWIAPMDISATTLTSAYAHSDYAAGCLGRPLLYAGDSSGNVMQLFDDTDDNGTSISASGRSGVLAPEGPGIYKNLLKIRVFGTSTNSVLLKIYIDHEDEPRVSKYLKDLVDANGVPKIDFVTPNLEFRTLEWEIVTTGIAEVTALELQYQPLHQDEGE